MPPWEAASFPASSSTKLSVRQTRLPLEDRSLLRRSMRFAHWKRPFHWQKPEKFKQSSRDLFPRKKMHDAGFAFAGQTEFFAERCGVTDFAMCLTGGKITVALVTAHVPLASVPGLLRPAEIARVGHLFANFLVRRGVAHPRIAVAGLNPHAGESGDLGSEEIQVIAPAVESLRLSLAGAAEVTGPHPPDTLFHRVTTGEFDGVLCMYHDQGLIPLKLHAFHEGVNVTLGLPFPRTSPDHGTAFEIAGKGIARPDSMISAILLACELVGKRREPSEHAHT